MEYEKNNKAAFNTKITKKNRKSQIGHQIIELRPQLI